MAYRIQQFRQGLSSRKFQRLLLVIITILRIFTSFMVQWTVVAHLGTTSQTDALYAGMTLPLIFYSLIVEPLNALLLPLFAQKTEQERRSQGWQLFLTLCGILGLIVLVMRLAAPSAVPLLVPGFSPVAMRTTIEFTNIQSLGLIGVGGYGVLRALLQARSKFVLASLAELTCTAAAYALLIWKLPQYGAMLAAWIQVLIWSGPVFLLLPVLGKFDSSLWSKSVLLHVWTSFYPLMTGAAYYRTGYVVDRFLASFLPQGSITILDLAQRMLSSTVTILNQGFVVTILPHLSRLAAQYQWQEFQCFYKRQAVRIAILSAALILGGALFAVAGKGLLLSSGRVIGNLKPQDYNVLLLVTFCMSGMLLCGSVNHLLTTSYYALGETRYPVKIQAVSYTLSLILKVAAFYLMGVFGIALAVSMYYVLNSLALYRFLHPFSLSKLKPTDGTLPAIKEVKEVKDDRDA